MPFFINFTPFFWELSPKGGVALIGGALTWASRRKRGNKRSADFEDFGLADTDFPHHRSPAMQTALVTNAAVAPISPTIPRLNDQGNFYGGANEEAYNNGNRTFAPNFMPQAEAQPYYYSQQEATGGGYYDEHGYYYEGQQQQMLQVNHASNTSYDMTQQYQPYNNTTEHSYSDQSSYPATTDQYYKPDQVDIKPHQHM